MHIYTQGVEQLVQFEVDDIGWSRGEAPRKYWKLKLLVGGFQTIFGTPDYGQKYNEVPLENCIHV